jgi:hypothetical protein
MPKYKNIKSAAHNFGYSFLSDMNYVGSGSAFCYVPEALYTAAKEARARLVRIDFLKQDVEPSSVAIPAVRQSVVNYARWLPKLLESQSISPEMVREARLSPSFDFDHPRQSRYEPTRELPAVTCTVTFTDDRGVVHEALPDKWCFE